MYLQRERRSPVCAVSAAISRNCGMRTGLCEREGVASGRGGAGAVCLWRSCTSGVQCTAQLAAGGRCGARGRCGKKRPCERASHTHAAGSAAVGEKRLAGDGHAEGVSAANLQVTDRLERLAPRKDVAIDAMLDRNDCGR